jgi:hypothetical protein
MQRLMSSLEAAVTKSSCQKTSLNGQSVAESDNSSLLGVEAQRNNKALPIYNGSFRRKCGRLRQKIDPRASQMVAQNIPSDYSGVQ